MAEERSRIRLVAREIRPHFLWDVIKKIAEVLLFPAAYVIFQKLAHAAWDWLVFGAFLLTSVCVLLLDRFVVKKAPEGNDEAELTTLFHGAIPAPLGTPTTNAGDVEEKESKQTALWKNSGNLFWLGHDLMYSQQVALRGLPRDEVLRALRHSWYHLEHLGLKDDHVGHFLFDLRSTAEASRANEWNDAFRKKLAATIGSVIEQVGALAANNQKDFETDVRHSHGFDSHGH
jgi:hypothetical protein